MIDVYNITGPQLRAWRADYMGVTQIIMAGLMGVSARFLRDQEKTDGRVSVLVARAARDIQAEKYIHKAHEDLLAATTTLENLYALETF